MNIHKYIAEFVGTFCLVFAGTCAIVSNDLFGGGVTETGIALTFGMTVMAMIYSIGDISGAHINPAVTLAFWIADRFEGKDVIPYIIAQCAGAVLASLSVLMLCGPHDSLGATVPGGGLVQAFIMEILLTLILMFVILRVASGSKETGIMAGVAIGVTVTLASIAAGPISGASMNPARSLGPAVISGQIASLWIYLIAPLVGASLAVPLNKIVSNAQDDAAAED
ncbi:MAG: MIP family channel protein [Pirellulaceae bacterium]|nr:MIP family channel protein [Pirellulaceae bacterium]